MHTNQGINFGGTHEPQRKRMPYGIGKHTDNATNRERIPKRQGMDNRKPANHIMGGQSSHNTARTNERPIGAMKAAEMMVEHVHPKGPMGRFAGVRPIEDGMNEELHSGVRARVRPVADPCGQRHQAYLQSSRRREGARRGSGSAASLSPSRIQRAKAKVGSDHDA